MRLLRQYKGPALPNSSADLKTQRTFRPLLTHYATLLRPRSRRSFLADLRSPAGGLAERMNVADRKLAP